MGRQPWAARGHVGRNGSERRAGFGRFDAGVDRVVLLLFVLSFLIGTACAEEPQIRIAFIGDSLTSPSCSATEPCTGYSVLVEQALPWWIESRGFGCGGSTTRAWIEPPLQVGLH